MKPLVIMLTVFLTLNCAHADALLNAMLGIYPYNREPVEVVYYSSDDDVDSEYGNNSEYYEDDGYGEIFEFEEYRIFCNYCDTEVIILNVSGDSISR